MKEQVEKARIDRMVESAGTQLASRSTRRGFLGRVAGAAGATLFGGSVILGEKNPADAETAPSGCFGTYDINVCYAPWRVIAAEAGQSGVVVRKGPSFSAPACYNTSTGQPVVIPVNQVFGRQSNRNSSSTGCTDPGARMNVNGFLWGYWENGYEKQGWIPYSVGGVTYAQGYTSWTDYCCGPGTCDWDCRDTGHSDTYKRSHCPNYVGCGGSGTPTTYAYSNTYHAINTIGAEYEWSHVWYYLRYGVLSTTMLWTVPGDKIKRYTQMDHADGHGDWWSCIMGYCCSWVPYGCRGWIRSYAVSGEISKPSACYPGVTCPPGSAA